MEFWLASYPRSGNSYLRIMIQTRYGIPSIDQECPSKFEIKPLQVTRSSGSDHNIPTLGLLGIKTHKLPEPHDTRPAVYIHRDGRDSLVSYAHFALSFVYKNVTDMVTPEILRNTISDLILEPNSPYRTWSQNVEAWIARPNTHIVRFEELTTNPASTVDRAVRSLKLELPIVDEKLKTFAELHAGKPQDFRSGKRGQWQDLFTPELNELFWKHNGATMKRLGYGEAPKTKAA
ncbi:MAG: hypothetical protein C0467_20150 [Planctomycetaceae bacterium]|nr:hypothetical protein [Planctomycetaceae bacterium]